MEGMSEWTEENWEQGPLRRLLVFILVSMMAILMNVLIPLNYTILPVLGLIAWLNDYY